MDIIFDHIETLKKLNGSTAKMKYIQENPIIAMTLYYTLNQFITFGIVIPKHWRGEGKGQFDKHTKKLLEDLRHRRLTGNSAKVILRDYTKSLTPKSAQVLAMIVNKRAAIGIGPKSVNKVWENFIPTHDVMLCKVYEGTVQFPCFASYKFDGMRGTYSKEAGEVVSRKGLVVPSVEHISWHIRQLWYGDELDGELCILGQTFQQNISKLRKHSPCPEAKLYVFDDLDVEDEGFIKRIEHLQQGQREYLWKCEHAGIEPVIVIIEQKWITCQQELDDYYEEARQYGYEGLVLTQPDSKYMRSRHKSRLKMKPGRLATDLRDVDLLVKDVYEGKGKYEGAMGGVICDYNGKDVRVGSGWTDEQRIYFWRDPDAVRNRIIKVLYMEETDGGSLRHTSFDSFVEDRFPEDIN